MHTQYYPNYLKQIMIKTDCYNKNGKVIIKGKIIIKMEKNTELIYLYL